jgi:hypothetical protein
MVKKAPAPARQLRPARTARSLANACLTEGTSGWSTSGFFAEARWHATLPTSAPC